MSLLTKRFLGSRRRRMPNRVTIQYQSKTSLDVFAASVDVAGVEVRPLDVNDRQLASFNPKDHVRKFHVWTDDLKGTSLTELKLDDRFTWDSKVWHVMAAHLELQETRWKLIAIRITG